MATIAPLLLSNAPDVESQAPYQIALSGTCSLNGGEDVLCLVTEISMTRLTARSNAMAGFADKVTFTLPHVGLLQATVAVPFEGGFEAIFDPAPQSKLATYLGWLDGRERSPTEEGRAFERIIPIRRIVQLELEEPPPSMARIIDLSQSGVAFTTSRELTLGTRAKIGRYAGVIIRRLPGGGAVRFDQPIPASEFTVMIDLSS